MPAVYDAEQIHEYADQAVVPANAGIQRRINSLKALDSGFLRNDGIDVDDEIDVDQTIPGEAQLPILVCR